MDTSNPPPGALSSPATARNREPILEVLKGLMPERGLVLEIAAGAGEHAVFLAGAFPGLTWLPTDPQDEALASIAAWRDRAGLANLQPPLRLDAADPDGGPVERAEVMVCINMVHISPWAATEGLMKGAGQVLAAGGMLFLYGPYLEREVETAPSNLTFDQSLRGRNPAWGLRWRHEVEALAQASGLAMEARIPMPANNLSLVFRRK
jgi:hypothetical protein